MRSVSIERARAAKAKAEATFMPCPTNAEHGPDWPGLAIRLGGLRL